MGEMGGTHIYRRWEGSLKCQKGGCHSGRGSRGGPLDVVGHQSVQTYNEPEVADSETGQRVLVFGVQVQCFRSDNYPVARSPCMARDEILVFEAA